MYLHFPQLAYVTDCNGPAIMSYELNKPRSGDK